MLNRRQFLKGAAGSACCGAAFADDQGCGPSGDAAARSPGVAAARGGGCVGRNVVVLSAAASGGPQQISVDGAATNLIKGSGSSDLDARLALLASDITKAFSLKGSDRPSLFFYQDDDANPNSFQVPDPSIGNPLVPNTRGSVVLGNRMIVKLLNSEKLRQLQGAALAGIVAHEFAHAYQRHAGVFDRLYGDGCETVTLVELHADYLAGFYMAQMGTSTNKAAMDFSLALMDLGDTRFTDPMHHGTPCERAVCMYRGRNTFEIGVTSIDDASAAGEDFIRSLKVQRAST